jgi:hypothetical protein
VENSETVHDKVLALVETYEGAVPRTILLWEVEYGNQESEFSDLGPHTRRVALFEILGNLADKNLVEFTDKGVVTTGAS